MKTHSHFKIIFKFSGIHDFIKSEIQLNNLKEKNKESDHCDSDYKLENLIKKDLIEKNLDLTFDNLNSFEYFFNLQYHEIVKEFPNCFDNIYDDFSSDFYQWKHNQLESALKNFETKIYKTIQVRFQARISESKNVFLIESKYFLDFFKRILRLFSFRLEFILF